MAIPMGAIEPGSTEYGDRQTLEQGLQALSGGAAPEMGGEVMSPTTTVPAQGSPFSSLLAGDVAPNSNNPLTAGLSVGPGAGPQRAPGPTDNDVGDRLRMIAEQSSSATLRRLAVLRLQAMQRGADNGS